MRRRLALLSIAVAIAGADRLSKDAIHGAANGALPVELLDTWVRLVHSENRGGLFGMLQGSAPFLAALSVGVIALLLTMHERERATNVTLLTISVGAFAGGAIGNLVDRVQYGYVLDFIDIGVGDLRFWTFNIADTAITAGILLILADAILPARFLSSLRDGGRR
jgi:signal peptidase II